MVFWKVSVSAEKDSQTGCPSRNSDRGECTMDERVPWNQFPRVYTYQRALLKRSKNDTTLLSGFGTDLSLRTTKVPYITFRTKYFSPYHCWHSVGLDCNVSFALIGVFFIDFNILCFLDTRSWHQLLLLVDLWMARRLVRSFLMPCNWKSSLTGLEPAR